MVARDSETLVSIGLFRHINRSLLTLTHTSHMLVPVRLCLAKYVGLFGLFVGLFFHVRRSLLLRPQGAAAERCIAVPQWVRVARRYAYTLTKP